MNHNPQKIPGMKRLTICVFCGSSHGAKPVYAATAKKMGELIAQNGYSLVFGGGANVKGILTEFLKHLEAHLVTEEKVVITPDLQSRKTLMLAQSDAFVVL